MLRVLLGYRGALIRGALAAVLSAESDLRVVAELSRTDEVATTVAQQTPHVAVLDGTLPGAVTMADLCRSLHDPPARCRPLVLVDPRAGASLGRSLTRHLPWLGLLTTDVAPADLVAAVRRLGRGKRVMDAYIAASVQATATTPLTDREREVLRLTRSGAPPKEIAKSLGLRVGTVRNHLLRSRAKTGGRTYLEATRIAQDAGWI